MSKRGWLHSNISGQQAEEKLNEAVNGSFLVRPSSSRVGDFTISVRYNNEVTHIKIVNDGDCYCLSGSPDPFATLQSLIQHYMDTPKSIKEKSGGFIELLYPIRSNDPTSERWYHGTISSKDAERILLAKGKQGSFLVRESQSQPGQFALAVRCRNGVQQIIIRLHDNKYDIAGGPAFPTLRELVEYYVQNPRLHDIKDQSPIKLVEPFQSTSFVASSVEERIKVLSKESQKGLSGFREEFELLQRFDHNDGVYTNDAGLTAENKWKNRYKNILPYDHSRVRLKGGNPKDPGRDYINANYIDVELQSWKVKYIAAQGSLPSTIADFWTMIYQHNSSIIVMLTNEVERGKNKCAKYWPDLGQSAEWGKIVVDNMLEHKTTTFNMRELRVYHSDKARKAPHMVYQYHYTEWPDHGAPNDPGDVLGLLNEIHTKHDACGRNDPIIVHCSAGIGRTGTVMVIDVIMHLLDEQGMHAEIDIQKTAQLLRTQRSGMIQTEKCDVPQEEGTSQVVDVKKQCQRLVKYLFPVERHKWEASKFIVKVLQYRFVYEAVKHYIDTENKRDKAKKESYTSKEMRPSYGNIDFSRPGERSTDSTAPKSPIPDKPVPRPPAFTVAERPIGRPNSPHRSNAVRKKELHKTLTSNNSRQTEPTLSPYNEADNKKKNTKGATYV